MLVAESLVAERPSVTTAEPATRPWLLTIRIAYRFTAVYFSLYVLTTQMLPALTQVVPDLGERAPTRPLVEWVAASVFGRAQLVVTGSGSGDKTFDWVHAFTVLAASVLLTAAWSALARQARDHATGHKWFRLFLRFALGATMVSYGAAKAIPLQMPYPPLTRLLEPFGHFSPMGVLWYSIGASRPYEIFTGCVEILCGVLLFIPATAPVGALLSLATAGQIFTLNMTYDVPVKLFSFHLVLMSLFLLAPDVPRLFTLLIRNRAAGPSVVPPLTDGPRSGVALIGLQLALGAFLLYTNISGSVQAWTLYGGGAPKSPLYGVWTVDYMAVDGVERAPLVTDYDRWRRLVFDAPQGMAFQRMDDTFARFGNKIDVAGNRVTLTKAGDPKWTATFAITRPAADKLMLDGTMEGKKIELRMTLFPREKFLLVNRGFNWIQEFPFNR